MTEASLARIDGLLEQLRTAIASPRNRSRGQAQPTVSFALEEPIASAIIFGYDVNRYYSDPLFHIEQTLRQRLWRWEHFPDDDAPLTLDLPAQLSYYVEFTVVGLEMEISPRGVPLIQTDHPLTRAPDLRLLRPIDFATSGWMPRVLRWYHDLSRLSAGRLNVTFGSAWWRGCLDLAIQLRGYDNLIADMVERPAFVHGLLQWLVEQRCRWYDAYYRYFGLKPGPVSIADDWLNVPFISPAMFADFVLPRYLEIERYHGGITGIHSCGNQTPLQRYLLEIKSLPTLEVSPWTDLQQTLRNVPAEKSLGISVHPNDVLCATPEDIETRLRFITTSCAGRRYSIGTSGLTPIRDTVDDFVARIRTWMATAFQVLGRAPRKET